MNELKPNSIVKATDTNVINTVNTKVNYKVKSLVIEDYDFSDFTIMGFDFSLCIDWKAISEKNVFQALSEDFIDKFKTKLCWDKVCDQNDLDMNFIKKYKNHINWGIIIKKKALNKTFDVTLFLEEDVINVAYVGFTKVLEELLFPEVVLYNLIYGNFPFSYQKQNICKTILIEQKLSEEFIVNCSWLIEEYKMWDIVFEHHDLSKESVDKLDNLENFKEIYDVNSYADRRKYIIDKDTKSVLFEAPSKKPLSELLKIAEVIGR